MERAWRCVGVVGSVTTDVKRERVVKPCETLGRSHDQAHRGAKKRKPAGLEA